MIWVVSREVCSSEQELICRHKYIEDVTRASVSPWVERFLPQLQFYQCRSSKGEYGIVITAHIEEVKWIIEKGLAHKKALVIVNACAIEKGCKNGFFGIVKNKNHQSELFFAKQEKSDSGLLVNYIDNVGEFGFSTSMSERELFRHRKTGLVKAIRLAYEKVIVE